MKPNECQKSAHKKLGIVLEYHNWIFVFWLHTGRRDTVWNRPFLQLSDFHDLDLRLGHMAYHHVTLIDLELIKLVSSTPIRPYIHPSIDKKFLQFERNQFGWIFGVDLIKWKIRMSYIYVHWWVLFADWRDYAPRAAELLWDSTRSQTLFHPVTHSPGWTGGRTTASAGICWNQHITTLQPHVVLNQQSTQLHSHKWLYLENKMKLNTMNILYNII